MYRITISCLGKQELIPKARKFFNDLGYYPEGAFYAVWVWCKTLEDAKALKDLAEEQGFQLYN